MGKSILLYIIIDLSVYCTIATGGWFFQRIANVTAISNKYDLLEKT